MKSKGFSCLSSKDVDSEIASFTELVTGSAILLIASIISAPTSRKVVSRLVSKVLFWSGTWIFWIGSFVTSFVKFSFELLACLSIKILSSSINSGFDKPSSKASLTASWPSNWDWEKSMNFLYNLLMKNNRIITAITINIPTKKLPMIDLSLKIDFFSCSGS